MRLAIGDCIVHVRLMEQDLSFGPDMSLKPCREITFYHVRVFGAVGAGKCVRVFFACLFLVVDWVVM